MSKIVREDGVVMWSVRGLVFATRTEALEYWRSVR